jgi:hypothetical protein
MYKAANEIKVSECELNKYRDDVMVMKAVSA